MHHIQTCTKEDYLYILQHIADFWGSNRTLAFHHPMFVHEFGNSSFVIKEADEVIAYLFGFLSQTESCGYVHLVGVRQDKQRQGLGRYLYRYFINILQKQGIKSLKAITTPSNLQSIAFHTGIGMEMQGEWLNEQVKVIKDYSGLGQDRVVFKMDLSIALK